MNSGKLSNVLFARLRCLSHLFVETNEMFQKEATVSGTAQENQHKQIRFYVVNIACRCRFANDFFCKITIHGPLIYW